MIGHSIGILSMGLGAVVATPLLLLIFFPEESVHTMSFFTPALIAIIGGFLLWYGFRKRKHPALTAADASLIVILIWLIAIVLGALPFFLSGILPLLDSLFESTSGWTTTGLTMLALPQEIPSIFLFWRALIQFVGGAGIIVIMSSVLIKPSGASAYEMESQSDRFLPHVIRTARITTGIYLGYSIIGVILYYLAGMNFFDAICHTMSAISTGGFSTQSESIGYWQSVPMEAVSVMLMLVGATSFATHYVIIRSRGRMGFRDNEIILMKWLLVISIPLIAFGLIRTFDIRALDGIRYGVFHAASALTGCGFSTLSVGDMSDKTLFLLIILMLIGGGVGSTAGGMRLYRVSIIIKSIGRWGRKQFYSSSTVVSRLIWKRGKQVEILDTEIQAVTSFIGLYIIIYLVGVFIFLSYGFTLSESLFELASALSLVGLSTGITGTGMPAGSKIALIAGMFLGRLGFIVIIRVFARARKDLRVKRGRPNPRSL
ncbi:MAG: Trk system potassium uptake protein TrkG [Syntrophomonadaceae bacterium]|nr:Trk system potassium uptake protein TrkG [Bacillota bacterium]